MKISPRPLTLDAVLGAERLAAFWGSLATLPAPTRTARRFYSDEIRRAGALRRAYERRRATLAAWDRAVATVQSAYYADWGATTASDIATYCAEVATLRAAGMVGPDDVAVGR